MVSICIPTYNNLDLFKRCLNSVLIQTYKDYEIIVSDDSDSDEIKYYLTGLNLTSLTYVHNIPALGSPGNWNRTLDLAKGNYIKILHHDDYFSHEKSLSAFVSALEKRSDAHFAFSYSTIRFKKQNIDFIHKQTRTQIKRLEKEPWFLFFRNVIGAPSAVFFRNDPAFRFNPAYKWLVDVAFYINYLSVHKNFVVIPDPLITVVDGEQGQISQDVLQDATLIVKEHLNLFSEIYNEKINTTKACLFFQELFVRFNIRTREQFSGQFDVPPQLCDFFDAVFKDMNKNKILKAIKKRLLTSRYNKQIFKIERF